MELPSRDPRRHATTFQRAREATSLLSVDGRPRPILSVVAVSGVLVGAILLNAEVGDMPLVAFLGGVAAGGCGAYAGFFAWHWFRAPYEQRDEAYGLKPQRRDEPDRLTPLQRIGLDARMNALDSRWHWFRTNRAWSHLQLLYACRNELAEGVTQSVLYETIQLVAEVGPEWDPDILWRVLGNSWVHSGLVEERTDGSWHSYRLTEDGREALLRYARRSGG